MFVAFTLFDSMSVFGAGIPWLGAVVNLESIAPTVVCTWIGDHGFLLKCLSFLVSIVVLFRTAACEQKVCEVFFLFPFSSFFFFHFLLYIIPQRAFLILFFYVSYFAHAFFVLDLSSVFFFSFVSP